MPNANCNVEILADEWTITIDNLDFPLQVSASAVSGGGSGDVVGPSSSTDENLTVFDGVTGKLLKDSGINKSAVTANTAKTTNATHTGDVTGSGALTIAADAVTNAKLANVSTATIKGRTTAGTGDPEDLTATQARAVLNVENGADVTDAENVEDAITGSDAVTDPTDAGVFTTVISAVLKKITWENIKATLKTYFDTLYNIVNSTGDLGDLNTIPGDTLKDGYDYAATYNTNLTSWENMTLPNGATAKIGPIDNSGGYTVATTGLVAWEDGGLDDIAADGVELIFVGEASRILARASIPV